MGHRFDTDKYDGDYLIPEYLERIKAPRRVLEVGVKTGGSLLLWCDLWPGVDRVVGIDIDRPVAIDHPRIAVFQADQNDARALEEIGCAQGPFDLVVDDASHFGAASWNTFIALWPHVTPGGTYVVEDWGTGYWGDWPDGQAYQRPDPPGHLAGMVGMVKRLVDEILPHGEMERLELLPGIAFAYKRS